MYEMSESERAERARVKALHKAIRSQNCANRNINLAWGFVRGFKFRRVERTHWSQISDAGSALDRNGKLRHEFIQEPDGTYYYVHNMPYHGILWDILSPHMAVTKEEIQAWLQDRSGAIPLPPPRVKLGRPVAQQEVRL